MSSHAATAPSPAVDASLAPATVRGADALLRALEVEGVDLIFGYPGGAIMPVYDALVDSKIRHILVRHEQGAALAANGYARHTGRIGVCLATSGPGATNLVTGIADAFLDSVPMVAITGQVATTLMGTDAFQEVDIFGITLPIVKHSFIVRDAREIATVVREAFRIAREGRPGPVLIDLPKDVANARIEAPRFEPTAAEATPTIDRAAVQRARTLIAASKRPLFYTGYGVGIAGAEATLRRLVRDTGIPVVSTLPPRPDFPQRVNEYNAVVVRLTQEYNIPIWDLNKELVKLSNGGIGPDNVHLSVPPAGSPGTADFTLQNLQFGTTMRNLTALQILNFVWRTAIQ